MPAATMMWAIARSITMETIDQRYAWSLIADPECPIGCVIIRHRGQAWLFTHDGDFARIDGGDPGDENDGE